LYTAGSNPEVAGDVIKQKIQAETEQTRGLFGFDFKIDGKSVSTNDIDNILKKSTSLTERQQAWEASKEVGVPLKPGLTNLRDLRNKSVQALGYDDYFQYQVSEYGYSVPELRTVCDEMIKDLWPLYRELHTWARYTLAEKYGQPVPDYLPAHWLPNRWGQDWTELVSVEGFDADGALREKSAEWIMEQGEEFYISLGFDPLPKSFYEKSSLYPAPKDAEYKKNNHASAWHMDLDKDVRSLMSIEPNAEWWETTLHELGHSYYYMAYTNEDVPPLLRSGANRAYHEAIGTLIGLASMQKPFLAQYGLVDSAAQVDETMVLLREALSYVIVIPWGAGVMTAFEDALYTQNLSEDQYNAKWWELKKKYQGIVPPTNRGEEYCDAASKTHINNDAAQYYDYAISYILLFQFHMHISNKILEQDPHNTNYNGSEETGTFLYDLMYPGASVDWREHLHNMIGSDMSAKAMLEYFDPLMDYLKQQNASRTHTLPAM
jgi:peptidyl-dipeptidase A